MLSLLVFFDRFIYYGIRSILFLYLIYQTVQGGLGWSEVDGIMFIGNFLIIGFFFVLIGGFLGDFIFGWLKTYGIGIVLIFIGLIALIFSQSSAFLYVGAFSLLLGTSISKPNLIAMLGNLYKRNIILKDEAFSINYVFINLGASLSMPLMSYISIQYAFINCFIVLLMISIIYFISFQLLKRKLLFLDKKPTKLLSNKTKNSQSNTSKILLFICICFLSIFFWTGVSYGLTALFNLKNDFSDVLKEISIFGNSLNMNDFHGVSNTIFIVILGMSVASYFTSRAIKSRKITPFYKISVSFLLMAISFIIIYFVLKEEDFVITNIDSGKLLMTLLLLFAFHGVAEMLISPIIISFVDTIASVKYKSTTIALYFFSMILLRLSIFIEATNDNEIILLKISFIYLLATVVILLYKDRLKNMTQKVLSK